MLSQLHFCSNVSFSLASPTTKLIYDIIFSQSLWAHKLWALVLVLLRSLLLQPFVTPHLTLFSVATEVSKLTIRPTQVF